MAKMDTLAFQHTVKVVDHTQGLANAHTRTKHRQIQTNTQPYASLPDISTKGTNRELLKCQEWQG